MEDFPTSFECCGTGWMAEHFDNNYAEEVILRKIAGSIPDEVIGFFN
jgi:hypothetical protein